MLTKTLLDLGEMPLANAFLPKHELEPTEPTFELHARVCTTCFLVQLNHLVPPENIFSDYAYFSSYSTTWLEHAQNFSKIAIERLKLDETSLVMEIGSNDGYLLRHFSATNIPVLGVDPAIAPAKVARNRNVPTEALFFGSETSIKLRETYGKADLMIANNVLAHVPDINDFLSGFRILLRETGVVTFEFPHIMNLIEGTQFDTIYHEHYSYLSLHSIEICLSRHGLKVFDVEELVTHGGSLRVWACNASDPRTTGRGLEISRKKESDFGIATPEAYDGFADKVATIRQNLSSFLGEVKKKSKTVAGYGAAAKGNTLLNYCKLTTKDIGFVVDANPHKQGTLLPGTHIPVLPPSALEQNKPDYIIILPWNIATEIVRTCRFVENWGGQFVIATPHLRILI